MTDNNQSSDPGRRQREHCPTHQKTAVSLQWLTWPITLIGALYHRRVAGRARPRHRYGASASGAVTGILILTLVVMERFWPAGPQWP